MTNAERINANNAELRDAIEMAEGLPDAVDPAEFAAIKKRLTELEAELDKKVSYDGPGRVMLGDIYAKDGLLGIGDIEDDIYFYDYDYNQYSMRDIIQALKDANILPETYSMRRRQTEGDTNNV